MAERWVMTHGREGFFVRLERYKRFPNFVAESLMWLCHILCLLTNWTQRKKGGAYWCWIHGKATDWMFKHEETVLEVHLNDEQAKLYRETHPDKWGWLDDDEEETDD